MYFMNKPQLTNCCNKCQLIYDANKESPHPIKCGDSSCPCHTQLTKCDGKCAQDECVCSTLPTLESDWERTFNQDFVGDLGESSEYFHKTTPDQIRFFIRALLSSHRHSLIRELRQETEKMKIAGSVPSLSYDELYRNGIVEEFLSILDDALDSHTN